MRGRHSRPGTGEEHESNAEMERREARPVSRPRARGRTRVERDAHAEEPMGSAPERRRREIEELDASVWNWHPLPGQLLAAPRRFGDGKIWASLRFRPGCHRRRARWQQRLRGLDSQRAVPDESVIDAVQQWTPGSDARGPLVLLERRPPARRAENGNGSRRGPLDRSPHRRARLAIA